MTAIAAGARLRARNQLTLPDAVVKATAAAEGDRYVVTVDPDDPDIVRLQRIRESYAGSLGDIYGDAGAYLAEERESWHRER